MILFISHCVTPVPSIMVQGLLTSSFCTLIPSWFWEKKPVFSVRVEKNNIFTLEILQTWLRLWTSLVCREVVLWQAGIQGIPLENLIKSQLEMPSRARLLSACLWPRSTPFFWTGNQVLETDLKGWQMTLDSANLHFTQVLWKSLELLLISVAKLQISHSSGVICVWSNVAWQFGLSFVWLSRRSI